MQPCKRIRRRRGTRSTGDGRGIHSPAMSFTTTETLSTGDGGSTTAHQRAIELENDSGVASADRWLGSRSLLNA